MIWRTHTRYRSPDGDGDGGSGDTPAPLTFRDHRGVDRTLTAEEASQELVRLLRDEEKFKGADSKFRDAADKAKAAEAALQLEADLESFTSDEAAYKRVAQRLGLSNEVEQQLWPVISGQTPISAADSSENSNANDDELTGPLPMHLMPEELQELMQTMKKEGLTSASLTAQARAGATVANQVGQRNAEQDILDALDKSPKLATIFRKDPKVRAAFHEDAVRDAEGRIRIGAKWNTGLIQLVVQRLETLADTLSAATETEAQAPTLAQIVSGLGNAPGSAVPKQGFQAEERPTFDPKKIDEKGSVAAFADASLIHDRQASDEESAEM